MRSGGIKAALAAALFIAAPVLAAPFDPAPWLADLEQARQAVHEKYANLEWAENEREVKIDALFEDTANRLRRAPDEIAARALFDRIERRLGDGHVAFEWPSASTAAPAGAPTPPPDLCSKLGYDPRQNRPGTAQAIAGYQAMPASDGNPFDAGTLTSARQKVGVIRIGIFQPQGYPELCREALLALAIPADKPCDAQCDNRIITWAYRKLTASLEDRIRQLKAAGATILLVDITNNGGGSEWAEAAARIFSPRQLVSERRGFVRGEHWAKQWRELAATLREQAKDAPPEDKAKLLAWATEADAAQREAETPCPASAPCKRIATAGYSTGLVGSLRSGTFAGKDWGVLVFNPAQFPYHDGVWDGPLVVLVDQETWSAAEEFAAVLQDNRAALIMGARTGGAGCGYTWGGTPTTLKNSGGLLKLPDCVRFRADGSNEVRGIIPDEVVGFRADDGARFKAKLVAERLPNAIARLLLSAR